MRLCSPCTIVILLSLSLGSSTAQGQAQPPPPPGTTVEVLDGAGRVQTAEFVEMTSGGQVKVKLTNGETRTFPSTRVRLPNTGRNSSSGRPSSNSSTPKVTESPEAAAAAAKLAGMRTWTDSTGAHKVDAEFVGFKNGVLELRKADGKLITLPEARVSAADQEIARFLAARPGQGNPFEEQVEDPGIVIATTAVQTSAVSHEAATKIDLAAPVEWTATVDPAKKFIPLPPTSLKVKRISGSRYDFGNESASDSIVLDVANQRAWIGVNSKVWSGRGNQARYRLEVIDIRAGGSVIPIAMPAHCRPESVDPTGRLLVTRTGRPELDAQTTAQLDIWELKGARLRHSRSFMPQSSATNGNVVWARFIDTTHLLTRTLGDQLVLWNIEKQTPVYQTAPGTARTCELSPGGVHVAIGGGRSAFVLEALTGKVLGKFGSKEPEPLLASKPSDTAYDFLRIGFSVDGAYVAAAGANAVYAWRVKDGECVHTLSSRLRIVPAVETRPCLSFGAYQTLIIDHEFVFDTKQRKTIYDLDGNWKAAAQYAGKELYVFDEFWDEQSLTSFLLPTDRMAADAATRTATSLAAVEPGTTVSMTFRLPFDGTDNTKIKAHLTAQVQELGLKIAAEGEKASLDFVAQVTASDEETIFQSPDGATQSKTGPRFTGLISIGKQGVPPLQTISTSWGAPGRVYLRPGETPESYAPSIPTPDFFLKAHLAAKPGEVPATTHYTLPKDGVFPSWR